MQNEVFLSCCDFKVFVIFFSLKIYIIHRFAKKKFITQMFGSELW